MNRLATIMVLVLLAIVSAGDTEAVQIPVCPDEPNLDGGFVYDFHIFNSPIYAIDPSLNFTVTVTDEGWDSSGKEEVGFKFENLSTAYSSVTHLFFDDGSLLDLEAFELSGQGVSFSQDKKGKNLPGGNTITPSFDKKADFSAGADPSVSHNGIHPGEWLKVVFSLQDGRTFEDVIYEIDNGGNTSVDNLRIGIHIQGLGANDDSVSAINCKNPTCIPEPATVAILTVGFFIVKRRR